MDSRLRIYLLMAFKLYDLMVLVCAFTATTIFAHLGADELSLQNYLSMRLQVQNFAIFLLLLLLWHLIFTSLNLYESKRISTNLFAEVLDVLKATALGTSAILFIGIIFDIQIISPIFLGFFWILVSGISVVSRLAMRYVLRQLRCWGRNLRHVLIVGTNPRALEIGKKITSRRELGYHFLGFVDDHWHQPDATSPAGQPLLTDLSGFQAYLQDHVVDEVIICAPIKSFYDKASRIIAECDEQGIIVRFASDIFAPTQRSVPVDRFDDQQVVTVNPASYNSDGLVIKHLIDFLVAATLLILLVPLFSIVCLLIKATSPGPIFFVQERVGLNKRRFRLYKFRTMVVDAEQRLADLENLNEVSGPVFKVKDDPRVTSVGKFLRKTSIDELPQLINVLKGDMSLVGPRPLPLRDYNGFNQDCHRRRLSIRPGITGLWQVGGRSSVAFDQWMELDLQYIDQWSLWLDLKILFKTIPAVVKGTGAS